MSNQLIRSHLRQHGIDSIEVDGAVFAQEVYTRTDAAGVITPEVEWIEVTGWGRARLYHWLGY